MQTNLLDRVVGYFNPQAGLKRIQNRKAMSAIREYEINSKSYRNDGWVKPNSSSSQEVSKAFVKGAAAGQELCRNNPLAYRMKQAWSANAVGSGISGEFMRKKGNGNTEKINETFLEWCETTNIDFEGHYDLYGLQWLWINTIVESGGVFIRKVINNALAFPLQLQTLEQTYLDTSKTGALSDTSGEWLLDGIHYKRDGSIKGYWIKKYLDSSPHNLIDPKVQSQFFKADEIIHVFKKERAGQHVGMTWFAANGNMLKNHDIYVDAKLMQQKIASCFGAIVSQPKTQIGLDSGVDAKGHEFDSIEPGMLEYVPEGTEITQLSPPKADNSAEFDVSLQRIIATSGGLTYEMLTGDYSRVNFASGRMGKTEFYLQLDYVQHLMLKPALNKVANWFLDLNSLKNGGNSAYKVEWTFPPRAAVNPQEEFDVIAAKVRAGFMSPSEAAQQFGTRLKVVLQRWKDDKALFESMGLKFDIDPEYFAKTGNQLDDNDAASANKKDGVNKADPEKKPSKDINKTDKK